MRVSQKVDDKVDSYVKTIASLEFGARVVDNIKRFVGWRLGPADFGTMKAGIGYHSAPKVGANKAVEADAASEQPGKGCGRGEKGWVGWPEFRPGISRF